MAEYIRKYNIPTYSSSTIYDKHSVVKVANGNSEYYFVSIQDGNVGNLDTSSFTSGAWWIRFDDYTHDFSKVWEPTYSTSVDTEPRIVNAVLEDGVTQMARDGINTTPLKFNLSFENISDREAFSLLCFFDYMGSSRSFLWVAPPPYSKLLTFCFSALHHVYTKENVNAVNIGIESSFVIFGIGAGQQKFGAF